MKPILRNYRGEDDFWRIRRFLQEVFLLNDRLEHSWHVSRWEYLRWHMIENCHVCGPLEEVVSLWETPDGQIAAVVNPIEPDEAFIHIHPHFRTPDLEAEIILHAEQTFPPPAPTGTAASTSRWTKTTISARTCWRGLATMAGAALAGNTTTT